MPLGFIVPEAVHSLYSLNQLGLSRVFSDLETLPALCFGGRVPQGDRLFPLMGNIPPGGSLLLLSPARHRPGAHRLKSSKASFCSSGRLEDKLTANLFKEAITFIEIQSLKQRW